MTRTLLKVGNALFDPEKVAAVDLFHSPASAPFDAIPMVKIEFPGHVLQVKGAAAMALRDFYAGNRLFPDLLLQDGSTLIDLTTEALPEPAVPAA